MGDVIEHLEKPEKVLAEVKQVLSMDGSLYVVTPPKQPQLGEYHYREYTPEELKDFIEAQGFVREELIIKPE